MKPNSTHNFDVHFKLETDRLLLRPFTLNDLDAFSIICADPEVMRYIGNGKPLDRDTVNELLTWIILKYEEQGFGVLAVVLRENNQLLGFCGLIRQIVDGQSYIELGYRLDRAFWGKGLASEAARCIRDYAINQLNLPRLISIIHIDNMASKNVARKVGMHHLKQTSFKENCVDVFYMDHKASD